jgi:hypothetical protein
MCLACFRPRWSDELRSAAVQSREAELESSPSHRSIHLDLNNLVLDASFRRPGTLFRKAAAEEGSEEAALAENDTMESIKMGEGDEMDI